MEMIGNNWWLWLGLMIASMSYTIYNQIKRMKGMAKNFKKVDFEGTTENFFSGLGLMAASAFVASISTILFAAAVAINITNR